jgi:large subunit ribosomal protein L35
MPKLKSNRGAGKRFRPRGKGGFKCRSAFRSHNLGHETTKVKRNRRAGLSVAEQDIGRVKQMLPFA